MKGIRVVYRKGSSEVEVTGDNVNEVKEMIKYIPEIYLELEKTEERLNELKSTLSVLPAFVKYDEEGKPVLSVREELLTSREAIMLILKFAENGLKSSEIGEQLSKSGIVSVGYPSRLSEMLREGIVTRNELGNYVLTEKGKIIADEIVNRLEEVTLR
ncbi:MAG: hypothetical protein QXS51_05315 [Thermoproteota archaeon]|nr:hypothetical protein [Candidatus Brockarchaeota archaeon]